jgi:LacI family transcriptional regulator
MATEGVRMKLKNVLLETGLHDSRQKLGICRYAKEQNWHLTFDERLSLPRGWKGDGVLTILHDRKDLIDYVKHLRIPVVDMGLYHPEIKVSRVIGDHEAIGRVAAEHFIHSFFRQAAWFSSDWTPVHALRFKGFQEAWAKQSALSDSRAPIHRWVWCEQTSKKTFDDWTLFTRWIGKHLRDAPKPIAVLTFDDYDAMRIHDACISNDLAIPEEVAILGVDDNEMICDHQVVPLASVKHDLEEVGYRAAELLGRLMAGNPKRKTPLLIPPKGIALRRSAETIAVENPMVRNALIYIKENIHRSFGAEQLAHHLKIPRSTLDWAFTKTIGHSIGTEILRQRLAQVKLLLLNTPLKIQEIAEQTGFCNASYLNNLFRKAYKQTPLRYRRQHKGAQNDL